MIKNINILHSPQLSEFRVLQRHSCIVWLSDARQVRATWPVRRQKSRVDSTSLASEGWLRPGGRHVGNLCRAGALWMLIVITGLYFLWNSPICCGMVEQLFQWATDIGQTSWQYCIWQKKSRKTYIAYIYLIFYFYSIKNVGKLLQKLYKYYIIKNDSIIYKCVFFKDWNAELI